MFGANEHQRKTGNANQTKHASQIDMISTTKRLRITAPLVCHEHLQHGSGGLAVQHETRRSNRNEKDEAAEKCAFEMPMIINGGIQRE